MKDRWKIELSRGEESIQLKGIQHLDLRTPLKRSWGSSLECHQKQWSWVHLRNALEHETNNIHTTGCEKGKDSKQNTLNLKQHFSNISSYY